ncbi:hypothetical protein CWD92_27690 [Burkholderia thailandensis]|nr:hypothetical protein CWD92_27690 [Burkholderia thailandensis]
MVGRVARECARCRRDSRPSNRVRAHATTRDDTRRHATTRDDTRRHATTRDKGIAIRHGSSMRARGGTAGDRLARRTVVARASIVRLHFTGACVRRRATCASRASGRAAASRLQDVQE